MSARCIDLSVAPVCSSLPVCAVFMPMLPGYEGVRACVADAVRRGGAQMWRLEELQPDADWQRWVARAVEAAALVLADVTDNNPYVMYELGVAHGRRRPTLLFVNQRNGRVPATVKGAYFLPYSDEELAAFASRLEREIRSSLRAAFEPGSLTPEVNTALHGQAQELLLSLAGADAEPYARVDPQSFATQLEVAQRRGELPAFGDDLRSVAGPLLARLLRDSDSCAVMQRIEHWAAGGSPP